MSGLDRVATSKLESVDIEMQISLFLSEMTFKNPYFQFYDSFFFN